MNQQQPYQPWQSEPGYDPTSSMPVMGDPTPPPPGYGPPQPGYGPLPPPGAMPPPPGGMPTPPRKSNTGLIVGLVIGVVVLLGLAGAGVWFFLLSGPGGAGGSSQANKHQFPESYEPTVKAEATGTQYTLTKPATYDMCGDLALDGVKKALPLAGKPIGDTTPEDDGTGFVDCAGELESEISFENTKPNGSFQVTIEYFKDEAAAKSGYKEIWQSLSTVDKKLDPVTLGTEAEGRYGHVNNVINVAVAFRFGNVMGVASIGINHSDNHVAPDKKMLANVMVDLANSGMNALSKG